MNLPLLALLGVLSACARRPVVGACEVCDARDESPMPTADGLTRADADAYERARELVCPGRPEDRLAGLSAITRIDPPAGRWRVPATSQVDAVEDLVAATPCTARDHAEVLVRAADVLARAEWELVGACLHGVPPRTPPDARRQTAAVYELLPTLRFVRQRAEAHCAVLAATHPDAAARSRCRALALRSGPAAGSQQPPSRP